MHKSKYFHWALLALTLASCNSRNCYDPCQEVIEQKYVHKYGIEIAPEDWEERGQCGQVISTRKDGTTVAEYYDNGVLHGDCTYSFPHSSTVARKESYDFGALMAETAYYRSGGSRQEVKPTGAKGKEVTSWYESGVPKSKESFDNDILVEGEYYNAEHTVEGRVHEGNGTRIQRDAYGQLIARELIQNGEIAQITTFHSNGNPKEVIPLLKGTRHGTVQTFLPDGEPSRVEEWTNGIQNGTTITFENAEVVSKVPYTNGVPNGIEERYRDGNVLAVRITWVAGNKHGPTYHYAGSNVTTDWFFQNKPVSESDYDILTNYNQRNRGY
ncbi:MAG: hypothetical protein WC222_00315 [Parachlamydiales bacterium]|jgi:antitoxin component YwqK of YwqJK toxin-antitoxin module